MISSSKRRAKGYRFDSLKPTCGLHLLFTTRQPLYPRCARPHATNTIVNVQGRQRKRTKQQLTTIYQKINSFASYTSDCSGGVFLSLYNSRIDLIDKQFDFFIIKSFTNIKIRVIINSQARRKEVINKWTKQNLNR